VTSQRDPNFASLDKLFGKGQKPLKRIGIVVFESQIQPTRGGLSEKDLVYASAAGKQLLTEKFLSIWDQSFPILAPEIDFVKTSKIKRSRTTDEYGDLAEDFVKVKNRTLAPDDLFYLASGKEVTSQTVMNPRGMRDVSFMLVPASDLMGGPKWSEHNKQYLNSLIKEYNLDAALVIMSEVSWRASGMDKHSGEHIPEELLVRVKASLLTSFNDAQERSNKIGIKEIPKLSLCYRHYEAQLKNPIQISVDDEKKNFNTIQDQIISPMIKDYRDIVIMMIHTISQDLKKTF